MSEPDTGSPRQDESDGVPDPERDEVARELLERAIRHLRAIGRDLLELLGLGVERARANLRAGAFRLLAALWLGLLAAAATVVGTLFVLDGVADGLALVMGGRAWAGRLLAGLLAIALARAVLSGFRRRSGRKNLERLRSKYARRGVAARPGTGGGS